MHQHNVINAICYLLYISIYHMPQILDYKHLLESFGLFQFNIYYQCKRQSVCLCFLLVGEADAERVWWGDQQTHRGNQHIQTSRSCHQPLTALRVILQDALISFQNPFLKHKMEHSNKINTKLHSQNFTLYFLCKRARARNPPGLV